MDTERMESGETSVVCGSRNESCGEGVVGCVMRRLNVWVWG